MAGTYAVGGTYDAFATRSSARAGTYDNAQSMNPPEPSRRAAPAERRIAGLPVRLLLSEPERTAPVAMAQRAEARFEPNAFIRIDKAQGHAGHAAGEMGEGIYYLAADDPRRRARRDRRRSRSRQSAPSDKLYGQSCLWHPGHRQFRFVPAFWLPLRKAGAEARAMLVKRRRDEWQVETATCTTPNGQVDPCRQRRQFLTARLAELAGSTPPKDVPLKRPKAFTLIGEPLKRLDTPDKTNGKVALRHRRDAAGVKFATLRALSVFGGKVGHVDDRRPGQFRRRQVVVLDESGRGRRRSHVRRRQRDLDAARIDLERGSETRRSARRTSGRISRGEREGRDRREVSGHRKALATGRAARAAYELVLATHDGTARTARVRRRARWLRDLDRHAGRGALPVGGGEARRPAGRQGDREQPPARAAASAAGSSPTWWSPPFA